MELTDETRLQAAAINCRLHEDDPQPELRNIGTEAEPLMVSKVEAWRAFYSRHLVAELDADLSRIRAVRDWAAAEREKAPAVLPEEANRWDRRDWDCAIELCDRARGFVEESGIGDDPYARRRLLAGLQSTLTSEALGMLPDVAKSQGEALVDELARIDDDERYGR